MASPSDGVVDAQQEPVAEEATVEQTKPENSFEKQLIALAQEENLIAPDRPSPEPTAELETAEEEHAEAETPETAEAEGKDEDESDEEVEPKLETAKLDKLVPLREVIEERGKKQRANERADRVEAELQKVQAQLAQLQQMAQRNNGPQPTKTDPLADIQDTASLDRLKESYQQVLNIDPEQVNEEGLVPVMVDRGANGRPIYRGFTPKQVEQMQRKAAVTLQNDIPQRREYLATRDKFDVQAFEVYPDLAKTDSDFAKEAAYLANQVLTGNAQKNPELLVWIGHAIYGYHKKLEELKGSNGKPIKDPAQQLVKSARTPIAPTASRTRSLVQTKTVTDRKQAEKAFVERPTPESAEAYVGAVLSGSTGKRQALGRIAE